MWKRTLCFLSAVGCTGVVEPPGREDESDEVLPGSLVITEVMRDSLACAGIEGQYLEVYNPGDEPVALGGVRVGNGTDEGTVTGAYLGARAYAVGAPESGGACHGFEPDFVYSDVDLSRGTGPSVGAADGSWSDDVPLAGWLGTPGASFSVKPGMEDGGRNNVITAWCGSGTPIGATGDRGSPGLPNPACPDQLPTPVGVDELVAGELTITEIMLAPTACAAEEGQWIEVRNDSGRRVNLGFLELQVDGVLVVLNHEEILEVGEHVVLVIGDGTSACTTFAGASTAPWGSVPLLEVGSRVEIGHGNPMTVLDLAYIGPDAAEAGKAWQLDGDRLDATNNDDIEAWCEANTIIAGTADTGTPGVRNPGCSVGPPLGGGFLLPGDLVITEIMSNPFACTPASAQFFEVKNMSDQNLDLSGLTILIDSRAPVTLQRSYPVARGAYALAEFVSRAGAVADCYPGLIHDFLWSDWTMSEEAPRIVLSSNLGVIDAVTIPGGMSPGASLQLDPAQIDHTANDDMANWCASTEAPVFMLGDRGTPQAENTSCADGGSLGGLLDGTNLQPGHLVISEVMSDPGPCSPRATGQYFEVMNVSGQPVDLRGVTVMVGGNAVTLSRSYPVGVGEHAIAEYQSGAGVVAACYPGLFHDFVWNTGSIASGGDDILLLGDQGLIDGVYLAGRIPSGASLQLDPASIDPALNDDPSNWCPSNHYPVNLLGDAGTPGQPNTSCDVPVDTDVDTDEDTDVVGPPVAVAVGDLAPGDLVISEFFADPVDCPDYRAEFLEIHNRRLEDVNLAGLQITVGRNQGAVFAVNGTLPAGGFARLGVSTGSPPDCYGLTYDGLYVGRSDDVGDVFRLSVGALVIDELNAAGWATVTAGASHQLDPAFLDAALNDDPGAWCPSTSRIPGALSDLGTPGTANPPCAPP